jgi:NAD(P)-dependent dehydrogenase (short-subunit alcohol dehydrogenase family)
VEVRSVLITGTTSGVGRGLLDLYAPGPTRVISVNRRRDGALEARYPKVRFECVDVRSAEDVAQLVRRLVASGELPDAFLLNAGINRVDNDGEFDLALYRDVVDTNLYGVLNFIAPITRLSATHVERHIVAVSSMVNYVGNPYGLGYYTSKRALTACFTTWARMYAGTDLVFKQVMLGPIRTAMSTMADHLPAWVARGRDRLSESADGAARAIARFAMNRKQRLIYPARAFPVFGALALGQRFIPGFFQGRKTLEGKRRRLAGPG